MDIRLSDDQHEIARQARRFLDNECPMGYVRTMLEDERGFSEDQWLKMAEMGWMGILIPEAFGGMGMELVDLAVIMEEMGRAIVPGPFFSTVLLAAESIARAGDATQKERYLPRVASGEIRGTLALYEPDSGAEPEFIRMKARADGTGFVLNGTKLFVSDAHVAQFMVVAARTDTGTDPGPGITLFLVDTFIEEISVNLLPTLDGTRKLCEVKFDHVRAGADQILGGVNAGWKHLAPVLQKAQVGLCAECVGLARRSMELATDYAKIRIQFDQPIGAFQAVKHRCAKMYEQVESARSALYWAAWAQDHGDDLEAALSASAAKVYCSEVAREVSASAIQVPGGTGFTWEHDLHFYLKRAKANEVALGDPVYHREKVAALLARL